MFRHALIFATAIGCLVAASVLVCVQSAARGQIGSRGTDLSRQERQLIEEFVNRALRLAAQYEASGNYDRAKRLLKTVLDVSPEEKRARDRLKELEQRELSQNRVVFRVQANRGWQDTGVIVFAGRPVAIEARGEWVFRMTHTVGPDGMQIPKEWREFPLGALIGAIQPITMERPGPRRGAKKAKRDMPQVKPFLVGSKKVITPEYTGRLFLKIHDSDESDNAGNLVVQVSGYLQSQR